MFEHVQIPAEGEKISIEGDELNIPNQPIIPFVEGDGIGPDIWAATRRVLDAAVEKKYGGERRIAWMEIYAGDKAQQVYGEGVVMPDDTLKAVPEFVVAIKGPLTTPIAGGFRSLNVTMRQKLDLYACVRPVRWIPGVPSPVKHPEKLNVVIFRENTEDVYAGIEWEQGTDEAGKVLGFLNSDMGRNIRLDSGVGIKPISITGTNNIARKALRYARDRKLPSVTFVHKGNIMKFTEGAFRDWGYELAAAEFGDVTVTEADLWDKFDGKTPEGKILVKDRIADSIFQQILLRPDEYSVLVTPNLNGDYLSDAAAAQVGGLGMAPGANMGDFVALFEATHGTAPKYAGMDKVNPSSLILSGVMMLEYLGWQEAADAVVEAMSKTVQQKTVTYDLARQMEGATELKASEYATHIIENIA
ncbi:MAG: isocitrate dehydrogenase (NADP(+)) [Candidatus Zixiibacteriota bacterium]|jgi:isocitrate dehydrogenase